MNIRAVPTPTVLASGRWLVSAQWSIDADTPEEAARAVVERLIREEWPYFSITNFDIGFRSGFVVEP